MSALAHRPFAKMNGLGNEIAVLDLRGAGAIVRPAEARAIGHGLGFDQLMVLHDPATAGTEAFIRIYNVDGSEAGACGNGTRCVAWHLLRGRPEHEVAVETRGGVLQCERKGEWTFTVDMGAPRLRWDEIPLRRPVPDTGAVTLDMDSAAGPFARPFSAVNMGNPHAIFWADDVRACDLARYGPLLEYHPIFPERANISLVQVMARDHLIVRVWERGVGLTRACGSAACASLVAAARKDLADRSARATLPGGDLAIEWRPDDDHVLMTGPVELEREGVLAPELFAGLAA